MVDAVKKIVVFGPGIVGMPMAALLARSFVEGPPGSGGQVVVVQRPSATSGWKVGAINAGRPVIGGVEPELAGIAAAAARAGTLRASHDPGVAVDADAVLLCTQTDRDAGGTGPDYGPLLAALDGLLAAWTGRSRGRPPLLVFESTLAPSTMATVVAPRVLRAGLVPGRDVLLANSPNRVMPGRLVARVRSADKIVGGLTEGAARAAATLYARVVTDAALHVTGSLTAEIVKTFENAWRDVRIAFAAEVARWCDAKDVDFFALRTAVNARLGQGDGTDGVPTGALLVPGTGVGGHCLPKDGILLLWRRREAGAAGEDSLVLAARAINDGGPAELLRTGERTAGPLDGRPVAVLGAAYRPDAEDTRNAPALVLARQLAARGCEVRVHDPYVPARDANLAASGLAPAFTDDLAQALDGADVVFAATGHGVYRDARAAVVASGATAVIDGANLWSAAQFAGTGVRYGGIGRGRGAPGDDLVDFVAEAFRAVERGVANELAATVRFLAERYAEDAWNRPAFDEVRDLAATCATGCSIAEPGPVSCAPRHRGLAPRLLGLALRSARAAA